MRTKTFSSWFLLFLLTYACALPALAANELYDVWDGVTLTPVDVSGSIVTITTASELAWLAAQDADYAGKTVALTVNIDLDGKRWTPIGSATTPFKGRFNGNGHLFRGLRTFEGTDGIGLFGHVALAGVIEKTGISGGTLVAKNKRRIGSLAGVCDGTIRECWSMAEIAASGNVTGGLVGELNSHGTLSDCYYSGLILNASDTIGGLVGYNNKGKLTRVYHTGYAKNGKAIVGVDKNGDYTDCYFDRKLYYQQAGVSASGVTAIDDTDLMYDIFSGITTWTISAAYRRYPVLTAFENTDAAILSAAPMYIDKGMSDLVNHANDLTVDFSVYVAGGVTWACQDKDDEQWINIHNSGVVEVSRPCTETDVLVDSKLNDEKRVVYMRPRRWDDFLPGAIVADEPVAFCFGQEVVIYENVKIKPAEKGYEQSGALESPYVYKLELWQVRAPGDTVFVETLFDGDNSLMPYEGWLILQKATLPIDKSGWFVLRQYAHDRLCATEWQRSPGEFIYRVLPEFDPGKIVEGTDSVYLDIIPMTINVASERDASGGGGEIIYVWQKDGEELTSAILPTLTYDISEPGTYTFTRSAFDEAMCCEGNTDSEGAHTFVFFTAFDPGAVNEDPEKIFCTAEEAQDYLITGTEAMGGTGKYRYQWYMKVGNTEVAIAGGTSQDLSMELIRLEPGKKYTFTRRAEDDSRFTTPTLSRQKQDIYIMAQMTPGAITNGEVPKVCIAHDAKITATIAVSIPETRQSTGEKDREYQWIRQPDGVVVGTTANLNYSLPINDITLGSTYSYIRMVRNPGCEWEQSAGVATQYYGQRTYNEQVITICEGELPYTLVRYTADGKRETHTFSKATDTWLVSDESFDCPADTLFRLNVAAVPDFKMESSASFCQSTGVMTLYFEQTAGLSNVFHITYSSDLAKYMGRSDTTGLISVPGTIMLENIPGIGTGDIYMLVQIGYTDGSGEGMCFSRNYRMDLYVSLGGYVYSKYDRVLFVDNNPDNGIDVGTPEKLEFQSYQWYKNGVEQEGQTGQYYHEEGRQLNGVYYVMLTDTKGRQYRSCDVVMPAEGEPEEAQNSAIYPVPANAGQALTVEGHGTIQILTLSGECIVRSEHVDGKTTITAPRMSGMYYVQISSDDGAWESHKLIVK